MSLSSQLIHCSHRRPLHHSVSINAIAACFPRRAHITLSGVLGMTHTGKQGGQSFLFQPLRTRPSVFTLSPTPSDFYFQNHGVVELPSLCNQLGQFLIVSRYMCVARWHPQGHRLSAVYYCSYSTGGCLTQMPMSRRLNLQNWPKSWHEKTAELHLKTLPSISYVASNYTGRER